MGEDAGSSRVTLKRQAHLQFQIPIVGLFRKASAVEVAGHLICVPKSGEVMLPMMGHIADPELVGDVCRMVNSAVVILMFGKNERDSAACEVRRRGRPVRLERLAMELIKVIDRSARWIY
jgi:hypothetical protein